MPGTDIMPEAAAQARTIVRQLHQARPRPHIRWLRRTFGVGHFLDPPPMAEAPYLP